MMDLGIRLSIIYFQYVEYWTLLKWPFLLCGPKPPKRKLRLIKFKDFFCNYNIYNIDHGRQWSPKAGDVTSLYYTVVLFIYYVAILTNHLSEVSVSPAVIVYRQTVTS